MLKRKTALLLTLIMVLIPAISACGGNDAQTAADNTSDPLRPSEQSAANIKSRTDKILTVATMEEITTADAQKTTEYYGIPLNIFDRLVESKTVGEGKSELVPGLAESWEISDDGLVYTFHLKKGVKFHNGEIFTSDDVKYTIERMLNPATGALNTDFWDMLKGGKAMLSGEANSVEGIKIIDDNTIELTLEYAYAPFLANIATPAGSIYNRKACEAAGDQFGIDPSLTIGTGPFVFKEWVLNDHHLLTAFDEYFNGRAKLDGIEYKIIKDAETQRMMFETGELDMFDCDNARAQIPYFENHPVWKDQIVSGTRVGVYYYSINQNIKPFDDVRVRKAFQMAIDKETLLDKLYYGKGVVANGIIPPGLIGYNPDLPAIEYNLEKAKELLAEAGYPDGFDMELTQTTENPNTLELNEVVQAMLSQAGINAEIKQYDEASWYGIRAEGKLGSYQTSWSADFNDPDNFMYTFFAPDNTVKRSFNYKNEEAIQRVANAREIVDLEERIKEYQELEKIIIQDDAAWVPLFTIEHLFVVNPRVKNFTVSWNGWANTNYYDTYIEN